MVIELLMYSLSLSTSEKMTGRSLEIRELLHNRLVTAGPGQMSGVGARINLSHYPHLSQVSSTKSLHSSVSCLSYVLKQSCR